MMGYVFAEIKDNKVFSLHDSTSLDLIFKHSDGLLVELTEQEYALLRVCPKFNIDKGVHALLELKNKLDTKIAEQALE